MAAYSLLNIAVSSALPVLWAAVLASFVRHSNGRDIDRSLRILLIVLAIDAGHSLLETTVFSGLYLSQFHVLPDAVEHTLGTPTLSLLTRLANLAAASLMLVLLARVWLPREVAQRKEMTRQAWEAGLRLKRVVNHAPEAVYVHDSTGRLLDVNELACQTLGYSRGELLSMNFTDVAVATEGPDLGEIWRRVANGEVLRIDTKHRRRDGSIFPVEISIAASPEAEEPLITALARDVTERHEERKALTRAVDELSQANFKVEAAIQAKNRFLETASYKLRTPLNTIVGLSEMIVGGLCGPSGNDRINDYVKDIHASSQDLLGSIDELSRVAAVEAVITSDQQSYRTIIEMSPDSICLCRDGTITFINAAGVHLLGAFEAGQLEGQAFSRFVHPDYSMLCEENFAALIGEATATPMKFIHPTGKTIDVLISAATAPRGQGEVLVVARNISDLTRANREVATQLKRLNSILDTAVDAIVVSDETGRIETFNRAAEAMFGYRAGDAIGRSVDILMSQSDAAEHYEALSRYFSSRHSGALGKGREVAARRKDGSQFPAEICISVCQLDDRRLFTAMIRDVTERRNFENHLAHSATHDSLTGLPNRCLLQDRLEKAVERAAGQGDLVAVLFVDLDGFKMVNDVMGHAAGDELLIDAGQRMLASVKSGDTVARFGGDEFTLVITGVHKKSELIRTVDEFINAMSRPFMLRGRDVTLSANVGIALFPEHAQSASELVLHASAAMMFAKATGRNLFRFFDPVMHRQSAERLTLENELRRGIAAGELVLHYQPQIELKTGRIVGLEALVRWKHPTMGLIQPARFIPIAEQTGLIVPLGEWVLRQACSDLRRLEQMGVDDDVTIGVNISARQFSDVDVLSLIERVIDETGVHAAHLDVEITESTLMNDPENVIGYLERRKALGVRLSIDDFGTGYSSLNYLKRFPVDTLKIDRSFVVDIADNPKDGAIAVTIITLAHSMGMTALAEGVEFGPQMEILKDYGCDIIQGFYYSKPLPFERVAERLSRSETLPVT